MTLIHFLNVGHGDCSIISHDSGRLSVIDINNGKGIDYESARELEEEHSLTSIEKLGIWLFPERLPHILKEKGYEIELTDPIEFLKKQYPGKSIFRYIQSHPDLDHMRGLAELEKAAIEIENFWDTEHNKMPDIDDLSDVKEWNAYHKYRAGEYRAKVLRYNRGDNQIFYAQDPPGIPPGDGWEILSPTKELTKKAKEAKNWNNLSYVLRYRYKGISVIFAGDAENEVWEDLVKTYGKNLKCTVLKASHHGRDSGFHEEALSLMQPLYTIVSVGKKPDNDASNKYRKYSKNIWSTRWKGNIRIEIPDNGNGIIDSQYNR